MSGFLALLGHTGVSPLSITRGLGPLKSTTTGTQPPVINLSAGISALQPPVIALVTNLILQPPVISLSIPTVLLQPSVEDLNIAYLLQPPVTELTIITLVQPPAIITGIESI